MEVFPGKEKHILPEAKTKKGRAKTFALPFSSLFQYDPATDTWTVKDDMPFRIFGMGTSVVGRKIYVIGGSSVVPSQPSATAWEFDPGFVPVPAEETQSTVKPKGKLFTLWGKVRAAE